ncbi:sorbitol dehydrogenase [Neorhizobium lilium]|uniref:Sorbitol dehydrogenase n=1 Tax=Neorhizobium lilium TaxID=2503024 RepID=A0A444LMN3_9HYPH|nr:sugar dehydrogenase complex small subunit [Neorhizobium lilium]RWX81617.1 sorbitol dehydrogenase [Neorhizobium lilium]
MSIDTRNSGSAMSHSFHRRDLLRATVAVGGLAALAGLATSLSAAAANDDAQSFTQLSEFLTGYKLDPVLGARYLAAFAKRSKTLHADIAVLQQIIRQSGVSNMDAFLALKPTDPNVMKTATLIVSGWYLGVVGEPADAELITYEEALMYRPTKGILPVPTYGPGPNAWGPKPDSKI